MATISASAALRHWQGVASDLSQDALQEAPVTDPRFFDIPWHTPSDQPYRISDRNLKRRIRWWSLGEYLRTAATGLVMAPAVAWRLAATLRTMRPSTRTMRDMVGVAVTPGSASDADLVAMVRDLGVRRLLLRVPVWQRDRLDELRRFTDLFPECEWLVTIIQNRGSICEPRQWEADLRAVVTSFAGRTREFQIGHAPNRTKWGCLHVGEWLALAEAAQRVRQECPDVILAGPALIDFEPLPAMRALLNRRRFQLDAVAALLYVDRRGAPQNRQYGWFDLRRKIAFQAAVNSLSSRVNAQRLWITEVNWPLAGASEAAPTSGKECVSEEEYAQYLSDYLCQAHATGVVERVYWWQLVAAGYGLVDPRAGTLRRRPGFAALQRCLSN